MKRRVYIGLLIVSLLVAAQPLLARVGGGESYSGGGSSGSGGSGGGSGGGNLIFELIRLLFWLTIHYPLIGIPLDILVIWAAIKWNQRRSTQKDPVVFRSTTETYTPQTDPLALLRKLDPNFSEIVFSDFCYSLYAGVHHARGAGNINRYSPFLSDVALRSIMVRNAPGLREVRGIVIGSFKITTSRYVQPNITINVEYESNLTEITSGESSVYQSERWVLQRRQDILSPPPSKSKAEHCPRCGAALSTRADGSCEHCGVKITDGSFQWYVLTATVLAREARGPLLTSNVPEQGTSQPTVMQPNFADRFAKFQAEHPGFQWSALEEHVRKTYQSLQDGWTGRDWERVRPLETEPLFQMHRYWIDAYLQQKLRNVVDGFTIERVEPVKITHDPFYDSVTVRIFANGRDYTVDESGNVVSGSKDQVRSWSEYWTFIRTRATQAQPSATVSCPNCGASVEVGATGVCRFCGGKLTMGEFGWVLSRIEQDEAYRG